jgi:hypothetical protein
VPYARCIVPGLIILVGLTGAPIKAQTAAPADCISLADRISNLARQVQPESIGDEDWRTSRPEFPEELESNPDIDCKEWLRKSDDELVQLFFTQ